MLAKSLFASHKYAVCVSQVCCLQDTSMLFVCHKYAVYKTQVCCLCVTSMLFACHKAVGKRQNDGGSGGHRRTAQEIFLLRAGNFPARSGQRPPPGPSKGRGEKAERKGYHIRV